MKTGSILFSLATIIAAYFASCGQTLNSFEQPLQDTAAVYGKDTQTTEQAAISEAQGPLGDLLALQTPVVVAHGKGENIATESTCKHMEYSVAKGAQVIELDAQIMLNNQTGRLDEHSDHLIFHDPTFHRVTEGYTTSYEKEQSFIKEKPELAMAFQHTWQFHLFDRISRMRPYEVQDKIFIRNSYDKADYNFLLLSEVLRAFEKDHSLQVPVHNKWYSGKKLTEPERETQAARPLALYIDDKDLVALARRLSQLNNWDWDRDNMSTHELRGLTATVLRSLGNILKKHDAFRKVFVTARHEEIGVMINDIVPELAIMISSENLRSDSSFADFEREFSKFDSVKAKLIELKFLSQVLNPRVHAFAKKRGLQVFYNQIKETDTSQFEGKYHNRLDLLFKEILAVSQDVFIQTNTVPEAADLIQRLTQHQEEHRL